MSSMSVMSHMSAMSEAIKPNQVKRLTRKNQHRTSREAIRIGHCGHRTRGYTRQRAIEQHERVKRECAERDVIPLRTPSSQTLGTKYSRPGLSAPGTSCAAMRFDIGCTSFSARPDTVLL